MRRASRVALSLALVAGSLLGPTIGAARARSANVPNLAGTMWTFTELLSGARAPVRMEVVFSSGGELTIRTACNRNSGSFRQSGDHVTIGPGASTAKACDVGPSYLEDNATIPTVSTIRRTATGISLTGSVAVVSDASQPPEAWASEVRRVILVPADRWVAPKAPPKPRSHPIAGDVATAVAGRWKLDTAVLVTGSVRFRAAGPPQILTLGDGRFTLEYSCRTEGGAVSFDGDGRMSFTADPPTGPRPWCAGLLNTGYHFRGPNTLGFDDEGRLVITSRSNSLLFVRLPT